MASGGCRCEVPAWEGRLQESKVLNVKQKCWDLGRHMSPALAAHSGAAVHPTLVEAGWYPRTVNAVLFNAKLGVLLMVVLRANPMPCAALMAAMMAVPWPLSSEYPEECRYSTLLQIR